IDRVGGNRLAHEHERVVLAHLHVAVVGRVAAHVALGRRDARLARLQERDQRCVVGEDAKLAARSGHDQHLGIPGVGDALRRDHLDGIRRVLGHYAVALSFSAASTTSSIPPTSRNACSGRSSYLPCRISWKPRIVSSRRTYLPGVPVNTSATWNGWPRNCCTLRARATMTLSSSDSSSMPRMAMMLSRSL